MGNKNDNFPQKIKMTDFYNLHLLSILLYDTTANEGPCPPSKRDSSI